MNAKVETQFLNTTAYSQLNQQQAQEILEKAQNYAAENELDFTGSLTPQEAWQLF